MVTQLWRAAMLPAIFLFLSPPASPQSDDLAQKSLRAKEMMASGQYEKAISVYRELLKTLPGNNGLLMNLAMAQHLAGHDREAAPNFETVLRAQPKLVPALVSLGASRLALNQPEQAIAPLQKAVAAEPANHDARGMLASALLELKRYDQSAEQYRKLSESTPNDPRAWYGLGTAYQSMATAAFERLQSLDAQSPYVAALIGDTRVQRRQYKSAFFFYNETLKQLPNLHGIHAALAELYRKTGHSDWAEQEDKKEQSLSAPDCAVHAAECAFIDGHDAQALAAQQTQSPSMEALYWQSKAANELAMQAFFRLGQLPPSVELHQLRAEIARGQGKHMEAANEWRESLALSPGNPRLLYELAVSLFLAQDFKQALALAQDLLRSPQPAELNFVAGDSLLRLEQPEKALPYLQAALKSDPRLIAADASLGLALMRLGKNAEAVPHLEKALDLDEDGSLHFQLARAYQSSGNRDKAAVAMAQYQEILKRVEQAKEELLRETQIGPPK